MNVYIPIMIIVCLYRNYLTQVMNQFDLEFKKLFLVICDVQSSVRLLVAVFMTVNCTVYFSWQFSHMEILIPFFKLLSQIYIE